jgi:hypothetical protein
MSTFIEMPDFRIVAGHEFVCGVAHSVLSSTGKATIDRIKSECWVSRSVNLCPAVPNTRFNVFAYRNSAVVRVGARVVIDDNGDPDNITTEAISTNQEDFIGKFVGSLVLGQTFEGHDKERMPEFFKQAACLLIPFTR